MLSAMSSSLPMFHGQANELLTTEEPSLRHKKPGTKQTKLHKNHTILLPSTKSMGNSASRYQTKLAQNT
ncbi:Protein of unknown function [Pyronema omphalodes CBS 100304]|uniref:Uncharacterized protein n=1 Tax=Pyronema omphalodes (strain CBS 100304) TaxID=1076935 RepID=U4LG99_PYROM|nr:Protein of unknown function [Pyronema omphalodes CBS 100304]